MSQHHSSLRAKEFERKKRSERILRYSIVLFFFLSVFGALIYASHLSKFRITQVELSGGVLVTEHDIETHTLSYLTGSYIYLFPKNNSFIYPRASLESKLRADFPRINQITITRKDFHTLSVNISERTPDALWCNTIPNEITSSTTLSGTTIHSSCFFMDSNSTIFANAPDFSGNAYFKYYGLISTDSPIGTQYIATSSQFEQIKSFIAGTKQLFIDPAYLIAQSNGDLTLSLIGGAKIYFNITHVNDELTNLQALLRGPTIPRGSSHELLVDYIDLRYGNKLFYVLKK